MKTAYQIQNNYIVKKLVLLGKFIHLYPDALLATLDPTILCLMEGGDSIV